MSPIASHQAAAHRRDLRSRRSRPPRRLPQISSPYLQSQIEDEDGNEPKLMADRVRLEIHVWIVEIPLHYQPASEICFPQLTPENA